MKSIKAKLVLSFSVLILILSFSYANIAIGISKNSLRKEAEKALVGQADNVANLIESKLETHKITLEMIAMDGDIQSMDWTKQQPVLERYIAKDVFLEMSIVQPDGTAYHSDGSTGKLDDVDYVRKALGGEFGVSDLTIENASDTALIFAVPIRSNDRIVGALLGRSSGDMLNEITDGCGFGDSGYAYIIDGTGTVVAHPDKNKVLNRWNPIKEHTNDDSLRMVAELFERVLLEKEGAKDYSFNGKNLYAGYAPVCGMDWEIVITADKSEVLSELPVLMRSIIIIMVIVFALSLAVTYYLGTSIVRPMLVAIQYSQRIADLDITRDIPEKYLTMKDETGVLTRAIQTVTVSLRDIISRINDSRSS